MSKLDQLLQDERETDGGKLISKRDNKSVKKRDKKEDKTNITADFDGLCDLVLNDDEVNFLLEDGKVINQIMLDDKIYNPPKQEDLDYLLPFFTNVLREKSRHKPSDVTDHTDDGRGCTYCLEIYKKLLDYHKAISELPNKIYYDLLVLFDYHTYLIEKFNFSPILYFFADRERGKTRTSKGIIYIARRGVMTETLREANIIRWGRDHKATLLFDIKNFPKKLLQSNSEDLIYGRAEKGVIAARVLYPERGAFKDTVRFEVFGPTLVTSNKMIDDIGISRTIMLEMRPSNRIFNREPSPEDGIKYREMLTGMRLAHFKQEFVKVDKEETGRLEDMLVGYLSMIKTLFPSREKMFRKLKLLIKEQKKEIAGESFEAQILMIILSAKSMVEEGSLTLTYDIICSLYNEGKRENLQLDPRGLGRITKGMGFTSKRNSDGTKRGILYDEKLINKLKIIYGIEDEEVRVHPLPSSESSDTSEESVAKEIFDI